MKWGLNVKFICYTVFIIVFISLVFSVAFIYQSKKALIDEFTNRAESLVKNLALNIEMPLLIENKETLESLAYNLLQEKDVQSVKIQDQSGTFFVDMGKGKKLFPWQEEKIIVPVYFSPENEKDTTEQMNLFFEETDKKNQAGNQLIGSIEVMFSRKSIIKKLNRLRWWIFIAATLAAVIGGIAGLYFSRTLILPLQRLAGATYSIARGNWEERLEVVRTDEVGQLTESFNIMAESLVAKKEELENTYKELMQKEKLAEVGNFSMIIAHELKNPLGIIKGSIDILAKPSTKPELKVTVISYIQDEVMRLNKLINDFLLFAKPTPPHKASADINDVVQRISDHFLVPEEINKKIKININLGDVPEIKVDEEQLYQVLLNLVNNAVQSIEKKGSISIRTACAETEVGISVSNTGSEIPAELKERIFEPFVTTKAKGTGLGLAIVKKHVENHQGRITVRDFDRGGTIFDIFLPINNN